MNKLNLLLAGFILSLTVVMAQQSGQSVDPSQSWITSSQRSTNTLSNTDYTSSGVRLYGKLVMADGNPLPELVQVKLVCNSLVTRQTYATRDGLFGFDLGFPHSPVRLSAMPAPRCLQPERTG